MKAKSIKGKSPEEIKIALQQSVADGFKPTLAVAFLSIEQNIEAICAILDKQEISIFGATSSSEFIEGEISEGSVAILLLDIKKAGFKILIENFGGRNQEEVAKAMGLSALESFKNPLFLICNSFVIAEMFSGESIISGLESTVGSHLTLWGGNAGDDKKFDHSVVFTNHQSFQTGFLMLVINGDNLSITGRAAFGWKPAGTIRTITRSDKNSIYTIDDHPALDIVFKFLGLKLTKEEPEKFIPGSATLCLVRENGAPVMRNINMYNWEDKSVSVVGKNEPGTTFRFAVPPDFEIVETVINDPQQIKDTGFTDADALVIFSCISRLDELGPMVRVEIDRLKNIFNAQMADFFTYGEFHNTTCCRVASKER